MELEFKCFAPPGAEQGIKRETMVPPPTPTLPKTGDIVDLTKRLGGGVEIPRIIEENHEKFNPLRKKVPDIFF